MEHLILIIWMGRDAAWATTTGDQTGSSEQQTLNILLIYLERGWEEIFFLFFVLKKIIPMDKQLQSVNMKELRKLLRQKKIPQMSPKHIPMAILG